MSTFKRLAAGQLATIVGVAALLITQVVSVRLILSRWDPVPFGAWVTVQAVVSLMSCPDWGLQDYEWIRAFQLGPRRTISISRMLGACMQVGALFGLVEFVVGLAIVAFGWHMNLLGIATQEGRGLALGAAVAFLTALANSSIWGSVGSYLNRTAPAIGFYAQERWWYMAVTTTTAMVPAIAIWQGASMTGAACWQFSSVFLVNACQCVYLLKRFSAVGVRPMKPHRGLPMLLFRRARLGYAKNILEQARQQGVRVLLALQTGAADVGVFATTRTISNVMLQVGLTLSNPIMPELASLVRERRAVHIAGAFTLVWIMTAVVIAPGALIIQIIGGDVFVWWTHHKLHFDPWLLASLITGVVWSFGSFPTMALVRSQNDFVALTRVMLISSVMLVVTMLLLVPKLGALGGGVALMTGELTLYGLINYDAKLWTDRLKLIWPQKSLRLSQLSLLVTTAGLALIAYRPSQKWLSLVVTMCLQALLAWALFNDLPEQVRDRLLTKLRLKKS